MIAITVLEPLITYVGRCEVDGLILTRGHLDLLDELDDVDGYFNAVVVHADREFMDVLQARGLARRKVQGSYYGTPELTEFLKQYRELIEDAIRTSYLRRAQHAV